MDKILVHIDALTLHPMDSGLEAEVIKMSLDQESFVLKVWNKTSKPDIQCQYHLLKALYEQGLSVSRPIAWGVNQDYNQVLLMTHDGMPISGVNVRLITEFAFLL